MEAHVKRMLVEQKVLARHARDTGIDKRDAVKAEIRQMTDMILMKHAVNEYLAKNPIDEKAIRAEYDAEKKLWGDKEVHVRHILVKDEKEAKAILADIQKGASFAKLASEKTIDMGSKEKGGLLDWTSPSYFTGELEEAVRKMKSGEVAKTPIKSPAGYHVVKLEGERKAVMFPGYEFRKQAIENALIQRSVEAFINGKVEKADVKDAK